jgi:Family of unknown function (DUF6510)
MVAFDRGFQRLATLPLLGQILVIQIRSFGALLVYAHGMGTVMRCPGCDAVVLRIARTRTQVWFDLTGAKLVVTATAAAPPSVA